MSNLRPQIATAWRTAGADGVGGGDGDNAVAAAKPSAGAQKRCCSGRSEI